MRAPTAAPTAHQCAQQGKQLPAPDRARSALVLQDGVSNASHGTRGHLIAMLGETVMKIFCYSLTASS